MTNEKINLSISVDYDGDPHPWVAKLLMTSKDVFECQAAYNLLLYLFACISKEKIKKDTNELKKLAVKHQHPSSPCMLLTENQYTCGEKR